MPLHNNNIRSNELKCTSYLGRAGDSTTLVWGAELGAWFRGGPAPSADGATLSQIAVVVLEGFTWVRLRDTRLAVDLSAADGMLEACVLLQNTSLTASLCVSIQTNDNVQSKQLFIDGISQHTLRYSLSFIKQHILFEQKKAKIWVAIITCQNRCHFGDCQALLIIEAARWWLSLTSRVVLLVSVP